MFESAYRKRLEGDLPAWQARGWIAPQDVAAILASLPPERPGFGMTALVATLGSVLLGLGAIGLVAANWEEIPRLVRFFALIGSMGLAYAAAWRLRAKGWPAFAEAALLLAGLIFAASIALVGQSYHLNGEFADAILLWLGGCLVAALLARSTMLAVLAVAGAAFWSLTVVETLAAPPHWAGLGLLLVTGAVGVHLESRPARGLAVLAVGGWVVVSLIACMEHYRWHGTTTVAAGVGAALALWTLGTALTGSRNPRLAALGGDMVHPALAAALVGIGLLQFRDILGLARGDRGTPALIAAGFLGLAGVFGLAAARLGRLKESEVGALVGLGAAVIAFAYLVPTDTFTARLIGACLVLAAAVGTVWLGQSGRQAGAKRMGLTVFGLEVAYVYIVTLGTVLDTALAMIAGGLLFIGLATALIRANKWLAARRVGVAA